MKDKICRKISLDYWNDEKFKTFYSTEKTDEIFFWGYEKNIVLKVNKNDLSVKIYKVNPRYSPKYFYPICSNDIEAVVYDGNCIIRYNIDKDEFSYLYITMSVESLIQEIKTQNIDFMGIEKNKILYENENWNLIHYLFYKRGIGEIKNNGTKKYVGNQIYKII